MPRKRHSAEEIINKLLSNAWQLLAERPPAAVGGRAGEPPHVRLKTDAETEQQKVGGSALIIAIDGG